IGGASVFSRAYGRNDKEAMDATVNTAVRMGIILALITSALGLIFLDELLNFFGATPDNLGFAKDYLSIILFGVVFKTTSMILNNFTRAEGRANTAMIAMVLGTGLNIILDPIFIFDWGLGLGVKGAAIATVISQFASFGFITYQAFSKNSVLNIKLKRFFEINIVALKDIVKIGLPTFVRNAVGAFLTIFILKLIDYYTADVDQSIYIAMYGVINRMLMFIYMPGFGLVQGLAPIAGYNYGAKNWDRLVEVIKYALKLLTVYFIGGFLFIQLGAGLIFDVFSESNDVFFIETGSMIFRTIGAGLIFIAFQIIAGSVYQSFGYAKRAMFISLSRQFIFFIPLAVILTYFYDLAGLWYTFAIADIISGIIGIYMIRHELKDLRGRAKAQKELLTS
ncbi:MATE family efflux transporter, partial [Candidatus Izimaplasma bacterium]|nr:MATE family efflux transporter [Candidatus Izimaplasma bacterium]